jgi:YVTN family beta-propeller protein
LTGVAVSPDNSRVYVTSGFTHIFCGPGGFQNEVIVIDTATHTVVDEVPVEDYPVGLVVKPDGSRLYVANWGNASISVINTASNTVIATIGVGSTVFNVDVVPLGTHVYASGSSTVSVIDTATNTVVGTVQVAGGSSAIGRFIVVPLVPIIPGDGWTHREPAQPNPQQAAPSRVVRIHYENLLSKHAPELSRRLARSPLLRSQGEALLRRLRPQIVAALDGQTVVAHRADLNAVETWIHALAAESSPELRSGLETLAAELRSHGTLR